MADRTTFEHLDLCAICGCGARDIVVSTQDREGTIEMYLTVSNSFVSCKKRISVFIWKRELFMQVVVELIKCTPEHLLSLATIGSLGLPRVHGQNTLQSNHVS